MVKLDKNIVKEEVEQIVSQIKPDSKEIFENIEKLFGLPIPTHDKQHPSIPWARSGKKRLRQEVISKYLCVSETRRRFLLDKLNDLEKVKATQSEVLQHHFTSEHDDYRDIPETNIILKQEGPGLVGGHYDILLGSPGLVDNTIAVCMMIELSKHIPASFVFFAGEEAADYMFGQREPRFFPSPGTRGSKAFVKESAYSELLESFAIVFDSVYSKKVGIGFGSFNPLQPFGLDILHILNSFGFHTHSYPVTSDNNILHRQMKNHAAIGIGSLVDTDFETEGESLIQVRKAEVTEGTFHDEVDVKRTPFRETLGLIPSEIDKEFLEKYVLFAAASYYTVKKYFETHIQKQ